MACIWVVDIVGVGGELFWRLAVIAAIGESTPFGSIFWRMWHSILEVFQIWLKRWGK